MECGELIPFFALLLHMEFSLPVKMSVSQPMSFLSFDLLILFPIPGGEECKGLCGAWLAADLKL